MKASDNPFPSVLLVEGIPNAPLAGQWRLYVDVDGVVKWVDETDVPTVPALSTHNHDADYAAAGHVHPDDTTISATQKTGTAYTLTLADAGTVVELTDANAVTVTVPTNATVAFPIGSIIELYAAGAAGLTVVGATGVTVRNAGALEQYATASLRKRATDEWVLTGAVT